MTICSSCGNEHSRANQRLCAPCHAAYMREWRKTHPLSEAAKKRDVARSYAGEYLKRGKIAPRRCQICGSADAEMHHPDHELPLQVTWLCRDHHLAWHEFWRQCSAEAWGLWFEMMISSHQPMRQRAA